MRAILAVMATTLLAGCATSASDIRAAEYEAISKDCRERGGELKPIPGATSNNEAANYACEFKGSGPKPAGG